MTTIPGHALQRECPDGGTCHHDCGGRACFRAQACGPLSGVYPGDIWPPEIVAASSGPWLRPPQALPPGRDGTFEVGSPYGGSHLDTCMWICLDCASSGCAPDLMGYERREVVRDDGAEHVRERGHHVEILIGWREDLVPYATLPGGVPS